MGEYRIRGQNPIRGQLSPGGAKNAVLPILAATVLNSGVSIIHNCPDISDTRTAIDILKSLGCAVSYGSGTITVDSSSVNRCDLPRDLVKRMRSSIIFMGSVLGRFGETKVSFPGGCETLLGLKPWRGKLLKEFSPPNLPFQNFLRLNR